MANSKTRLFASGAAKSVVKWPDDKPFGNHTMTVDNIIMDDSQVPGDRSKAAYAFKLNVSDTVILFKKYLFVDNLSNIFTLS